MAGDSFRLFPFQEEAAERLRDAALDWIGYSARNGAPRYGATRIPFLGQLRAVTGSGKTPILAEVVGGLGDAVVLWTTRSSAVVQQTFTNLTSRYRALLPPETQVLRDIPSQVVWRDLIDKDKGLTIWVLTVASWNEADAAGDDSDARLRLRREQPDWAGEGSPWSQLQEKLERPLWIVSDESHNQSAVQLDQLASLRPKGFFMASATPVVNDLFSKWAEALEAEDETRELIRRAQVPVLTRDVVDANLLKTTIELIDYRSGTEESLDGTLEALKRVEEAAQDEDAGITPRAIYVVEKSNPPRGSHSEARPVTIWKHLRSRGVPVDEIAIFTDTKEIPEDAKRITSLSQLTPDFRHIIFNQTLQEGWDDPEAYVCYFDGVTKSFIRIRQIVGRVLRQPSARRFTAEALNTATLILQTPADSYEAVVGELRAELRLYAPENEPAFSAVRLKTRTEPLDPIPVKKAARSKLRLKRYALRAPSMTNVEKLLQSAAHRPWSEDDLLAPGTGRKATLDLDDGSEEFEYIDVLRSARTQNAAYLRQRILQRNRPCVNAIHFDWLKGPAFEQMSCHGSQAQADLQRLAVDVVDYFEDRVGYELDPDPDRQEWVVGEYRPRGKAMTDFDRAAHACYSEADFNGDERVFARALDQVPGVVWTRNGTSASSGYGIPLPEKVGDSATFYPDFIVAKKDVVWAIDTTGRHLLNEKIEGKLISLGSPRLALVVRGEVDLTTRARTGKAGWSLVIARPNLKPILEHSDDLDELLKALFTTDA